MKLLSFIDKLIEKLSTYFLVVAIFSMLTLSVLNIVFRWFGVTFHWIEPLVRHLVFLATFLGGALATGRGTHICIDILGKYLENSRSVKLQIYIKRFVSLVSCLSVLWILKASYDFSVMEFEYGKEIFLGVHSGHAVSIIPFGFSLISYRFFFQFISTYFPSKKQVLKEVV